MPDKQRMFSEKRISPPPAAGRTEPPTVGWTEPPKAGALSESLEDAAKNRRFQAKNLLLAFVTSAYSVVSFLSRIMGNSRSLIIVFSLLFIIKGGSASNAQTPPNPMQQFMRALSKDPNLPAPSKTPSPAMQQQDTPTDITAPKIEVPTHSSKIILDDNLLSVEFVNVSFEEIIKELGKKAGFSIEGTSTVFSKTVTTKFKDLDVETGVMRLFSLVKENNYNIYYDSKGTMSKLKLYNINPVNIPQIRYSTGTSGSSPEVSRTLQRRLTRRSRQQPDMNAIPPPPAGFRQTVPPPTPATPPTRARRSPFTFRVPGVYQAPKVSQPEPTPVPTPETKQEVDIDDTDSTEEDVQEIPYTPP